MKKLFLIALTALTLALFAGCSDSDPAAPALDPVPADVAAKAAFAELPLEQAGKIHNDLLGAGLKIYQDFGSLKGTYGLFARGEFEAYVVRYFAKNFGIPSRETEAACRDIQSLTYPDHWFDGELPVEPRKFITPAYIEASVDKAVAAGNLTPECGAYLQDGYVQLLGMMDNEVHWNEVHWAIAQLQKQLPDQSPAAVGSLAITAASARLWQERIGAADDALVSSRDIPYVEDGVSFVQNDNSIIFAMVRSLAAYLYADDMW